MGPSSRNARRAAPGRRRNRPVPWRAPTLACLLLLAGRAETVLSAPAEAGAAPDAAGDRILLSNGICRLECRPGRGGAITACEVRDGEFSLKLPAGAELFRAAFSREGIEKAPPDLSFERRSPADAPTGTAIDLAADLDAAAVGDDAAGLRLKRRIALPPGKRCIEIVDTLENPTEDVMGAQLGCRQRLRLAETKGGDTVFVPTERSILQLAGNSIAAFYSRTSDWEYKPVEGWMAVIDRRSAAGLVFLIDLRILDSFYYHAASGTSGWLLDGGILEPGASMAATCCVVPLRGFRALVHASRRLLADVAVRNVDAGLDIVHTVAGAEGPLGDVVLATTVHGVRSGSDRDLLPVTLVGVGLAPTSSRASVPLSQKEPLVVRVKATGSGWEETYETCHEGKFRPTVYPGYPYVPEYRRSKPEGGS